MRKWIGVICVFLGVLCILSAIGLVAYNRWEDENAEKIAQDLLEDVQSIIEEPQPELPLPDDTKMATVEVGGYDCIGILSVPVLDLELPVLIDWS